MATLAIKKLGDLRGRCAASCYQWYHQPAEQCHPAV